MIINIQPDKQKKSEQVPLKYTLIKNKGSKGPLEISVVNDAQKIITVINVLKKCINPLNRVPFVNRYSMQRNNSKAKCK